MEYHTPCGKCMMVADDCKWHGKKNKINRNGTGWQAEKILFVSFLLLYEKVKKYDIV